VTGDERREEILNLLLAKEEAITGGELADKFTVSRQAIVQDIALLRAQGEEILATSQGYIMSQHNNQMVIRTIACRHNGSEIEEELKTIIKYGGRVKDVIVEHPIYGELKGLLRIQSKSDLNSFIKKYNNKTVKPLLTLTEGVHLHTIEALNQEVLDLIEERLEEQGFLLTDY
jgi:hypothetical protein